MQRWFHSSEECLKEPLDVNCCVPQLLGSEAGEPVLPLTPHTALQRNEVFALGQQTAWGLAQQGVEESKQNWGPGGR